MSVRSKSGKVFVFAGKLLFSAAVFLATFEISARLTSSDTRLLRPLLKHMVALPECHQVSSDPELLYELNPDSVSNSTPVTYRINALGFRDPEREKQKPKGVFRIVCLGASTVFGAEVNDHEAYPRYLETVLCEKLGRPVEVWNAGVSGMVMRQHVAMAKRVIENYSPDLLIFFHSNTGRRSILADRPHAHFFSEGSAVIFGKLAVHSMGGEQSGVILFRAFLCVESLCHRV
jgi:hypothetical protein